MRYLPPGRVDDFSRSRQARVLQEAWHQNLQAHIRRYSHLTRFLDPLKADDAALVQTIPWNGFPRLYDAWLDIQTASTPQERKKREDRAHRSVEHLYRFVFVKLGGQFYQVPADPDKGWMLYPSIGGSASLQDAFSFAERPQDEYLEWFVVRDPANGRVTRIDYTAESPEYWEALATHDPDLTATLYTELLGTDVPKEDLFFQHDVLCPEIEHDGAGGYRLRGHVPLYPEVNNYKAGSYNRRNRWNTERGAVHLTQKNNTLFAEIDLAAQATKRFAIRPDLFAQVDRFALAACAGYGALNRNSDPTIGQSVNSLVLSGFQVMVSNPIGLYIGEVDLTDFRDPQGRSVPRAEILTVHRGSFSDADGLARVLRFSIHPPHGASYGLEACTLAGHPLVTGGPVARQTTVVIHGIAQPATTAIPTAACHAKACAHPTKRPQYFLGTPPDQPCPGPDDPRWQNSPVSLAPEVEEPHSILPHEAHANDDATPAPAEVTETDQEPTLATEDIQGHIFPGFGTSHTVIVAMHLQQPEQGRLALARLLPEVTTMAESLRHKEARRQAARQGAPRPTQPTPSLSIALAATALRAWGHDTQTFDPSFHTGMRADAASLGDPMETPQRPHDWTFNNQQDAQVDILLIAGHSDKHTLEEAVARWQTLLAPHLDTLLVEYGRRREGDREFFGFKDGISQPAMRGLTPDGTNVSSRNIDPKDPRATLFAKPGQLLLWPGAFLFGYPQQSTVLKTPGPPAAPPAPWMQNGSYLVFRRLRQDVDAFQHAVKSLHQELVAAGEHVTPGWVAARLVGRWPDGTPLSASPQAAAQSIGSSSLQNNNFQFFASLPPTPLRPTRNNPQPILPQVPADPIGLACPRASHIRQVNPRDGISEIGQEHHPAKLMLRRGAAFGPEPQDAPQAERGLLFLAYQTSIVSQFKFVQTNWANATHRPTGDGRDPLIGQDGTQHPRRQLQLFGPSRRQHRCPLHGRWVIPTGGDYFVTPAKSGLQHLLLDTP